MWPKNQPEPALLSALKINQLETVTATPARIWSPRWWQPARTPIRKLPPAPANACPSFKIRPRVDEFCRLWSETRSPLLGNCACYQARYTGPQPGQVRLLVALKTGAQAAAEKTDSAGTALPAGSHSRTAMKPFAQNAQPGAGSI